MAETISQAGITCIGMWAEILTRLRSSTTSSSCGRTRPARPCRWRTGWPWNSWHWSTPSQAGIAFLLPGLMNGYGRFTEELKEIRERLVVLEQKVYALGR